MISASTQLKNLLYESRSIKIGTGATVEYNMNEMLDNILVSTTISENTYLLQSSNERVNPFKKLFPIDSIIKPNRPINSGVKYYILRDSDHQGSNKFYDYRKTPYPEDAPRVYYPGVETEYKYWVTPINTGVNLTVQYIIEQASVIEAYSTGPDSPYPNRVVYKTSAEHGFNVGQKISITGSGNTNFNLIGVIDGVIDPRTFYITNSLAASNPITLSKTATIVNQDGVATPTKSALANKIVIRFEKYHALPSTCNIVINYKTGPSDTVSAISVPSNGEINIYWNGLSWTTAGQSPSLPISYSSAKEVRSINVTTPAAAGGGQIIGVIEVSARWLKDISGDIVSFDIEKESTSNASDLLPVGNITSNSISLELARYNKDNILMLDYNRDKDWTSLPSFNDVIYFAKNMQISPYFKFYHSNGAVTEGSKKYDRIQQGLYYLYEYSITEHGEATVQAFDGFKILMETIAPDLIYAQAKITSVIMSILDSIGFTNYKINMLLDENENLIDESIPSVAYWWSESSKTIWDHLQELCRDAQINAFFDENNVLQFYTRDFMYKDKNVDWEFYQEKSGSKLSNIISFNKREIPTANQVKVIWKTPINSIYTKGAEDLWSSEVSYLISGGLTRTIAAETPAENIDFFLNTDEAVDPYLRIDSSFNFSGYLLVDSEIFEYDGIEFEYVPIENIKSDPKVSVYLSSQADWSKYRPLALPGIKNFYPTGRFRIKKRAALGTSAARHEATVVKPGVWKRIKEDVWT